MQPIVYYVATSLDGFIAGPNADISMFVQSGNGVERYMADLQDYQTVIMGRHTYEFGYAFGLKPGQPAYPHMDHYIFSNSMTFENPHEKVRVLPIEIEHVHQINQDASSPIYLCGGGQFAGWLLDHNLIDQLILKVNPIVLGDGTPLFGNSKQAKQWNFIKSEHFDHGLQIAHYNLIT